MDDLPQTEPASHSGDQKPFLVRVAERLSRGTEAEKTTPIEKALWAMVLVSALEMDTNNLTVLLSMVL